ncbi:hypothetical protein N6B72_06095 [Chryseobacterium soli]|jgi:hypothetical protein|uniref:hypothetical protein n=1 Tax=Chryseobacterium soli TaxID=445961 RepID=UPI002954A5C7|nr:hypothetical protein [Chryseobacterium soli]MDV7696488.1 hypothetical protein [Chryseobacterium soli]
MKNSKRLNRQNLKEVLGGHTCPAKTFHVVYNGYHACCLQIPSGNPCSSTKCLVPIEMCDPDLS